jgi:hypothetical protein
MNGSRRRGLQALSGLTAWGAVGPAIWGLSACGREAGTLLPPQVTGDWLGPVMARGHRWRDGPTPAHAAADQARRVHVLVVGAGVAGLSAAHHLMQAGVDDLAVIDLDDVPGGNAQGHHMAGLACPVGAHYLPMPGPEVPAVQAWLAEIGVIRHEHGRWRADERYACHAPQERLFVPEPGAASGPEGLWRRGHWQDGLWPPMPPSTAAQGQWRRLADAIAQVRRDLGFAMPTHSAPWTRGHDALDGQTFAHWLDTQGFTDPGLRWSMDYVCRDDYGAGAQRVSAWAGLHYFASRHGLNLPGGAEEAHDPVLTWPEGNGWLTQRLAAPLRERWHPGQVAHAVRDGRDGLTVHTMAAGQPQRWLAQHVVLAVPLRLAQRLLDVPLAPLQAVQPHLAMAPWLVSNLLLSAPLDPRPGEELSWDNVFYTDQGVAGLPPSLGYVNARHQSLAQPVGHSLLTHYWALGGDSPAQELAWRRALHEQPWRHGAEAVCRDLVRVHPDLPAKLLHIDLRRHGHAMAIPQPGLRGHPGLPALMRPQGVQGRLHFAHADLSGYSVFEEAFTHGERVARAIVAAGRRQAPGRVPGRAPAGGPSQPRSKV